MKISKLLPIWMLFWLSIVNLQAQNVPSPEKIKFVRQGVHRFIFDEKLALPLASLIPEEIIGIPSMYPVKHHLSTQAEILLKNKQLILQSTHESQTSIWFGGFNPFATYSIELGHLDGNGDVGFEFTNQEKTSQFFIKIQFLNNQIAGVQQKIISQGKTLSEEAITNKGFKKGGIPQKIILQMLGSGLTVFAQSEGQIIPIGQSDFSQYLDLRKKECLHTYQSHLFVSLQSGRVEVNKVSSVLGAGMGLADIRAITYEDGEPMLDQGRLWYTMSIRGRALPHHIQGVFSMNPSLFDLKLEGIVLFDRNDGLLRNEIASHIFYDRKEKLWRGLTTGFSAYANPQEKKQLLAIEGTKDPRFGFSIMKATPFGIVGDIEDPHILYDSKAKKWRILTCENQGGYKAVMLESKDWNKNYQKIAGPVSHNSTGTSIQKICGQRYCFSGSQEREIFIYSYPDLQSVGTLKMDLPPWDEKAGTRVWPNVVQLPDGYPFKYVALMMDRYNYPNLEGPNWTYGALYLYHGVE